MKTEKRENYIKNLYAGIHTLASKTESIDQNQALNEPITKSCTLHKVRGKDEHEYYLQLNPNKATNDEIITSYKQFEAIMMDYMDRTACSGLKVTRADFAFNSAAEGDFQAYLKLNKLLVCCIADAHNIKNCYAAKDLWSNRDLSVAVKSDYIEAENYDKAAESQGKSEAKNRLELRSKRLTGSIPEEFCSKWSERLDKAKNSYENVQKRYNDELLKIWQQEQALELKKRKYLSATGFILAFSDCIFSRKQLIDLLEKMGSKNPRRAADKIKYRHNIEFFSKKDIQNVVKALKEVTLQYFTN